MVSNTYTPGIDHSFMMTSIETDHRNDRVSEECKEEDKDSDKIMSGLSNGWKKNALYKGLLVNFELSSFEDSAIVEIYKDWVYGWHHRKSNSKRSEYKYRLLSEGVDHQMKQLIIQIKEQGSTADEISALLNIDNILWRSILNERKYLTKKKMKQ